ncbi:MAG: dethiobiotin synthase [Epsilonproteobacteria bacterium]|nr:dethiobiotin synthase [Campylobacterota bacterium]
MKLLFVTATNTDIGKTYTTLKLIELFANQGIKIGVCKPIETGVNNTPLDASQLLQKVQQYNANFKPLTPKDITAFTFKLPAAPFCADVNHTIKIEKIKEKIKELEGLCDLLIVEGAGGLMVPITHNYMMIDLAKELEAKTLLVTPSKLGCINDTLLSIEALKNRKIPFEWCVNLFEDREEFAEVTQPFYDKRSPEWWSVQDGLEEFVQNFITTES